MICRYVACCPHVAGEPGSPGIDGEHGRDGKMGKDYRTVGRDKVQTAQQCITRREPLHDNLVSAVFWC